MNKSTLLRLFGWLCILVVVGLICYVVLFYYGEYLGVETQTTRIIVVTTVLLALCYIFKLWQMNALKSVLISYVPLLKYKSIIYFFMPWKSSDKANVGNNTTATLDSNIFINIHSTLKENYGRRWRAKTRGGICLGNGIWGRSPLPHSCGVLYQWSEPPEGLVLLEIHPVAVGGHYGRRRLRAPV